MTHRKSIYVASLGLVVLALLSLGMSSFTLKVPNIQSTTQVWVDDDDPTCGGNSPCFRTIQAAVDALSEGRVYIRPGIYREHVVLTKNVELIGSGRELVRLEAPDPTKPVILVKKTFLSDLKGLSIFGGSVGIQLEDVQVFAIQYNRIAGYTETGIRFIRSKTSSDMSIFFNELLDQPGYNTKSSIQLLEGSSASIFRNTIRSPIEIEGKGSTANIQENILAGVNLWEGGEASIIKNQLVNPIHGGAGIFVGVDSKATIISNHIQGYPIGIILGIGSRANIISNVISQNDIGISSGHFVQSTDRPPRFRIIRNRIIANTGAGLALFAGQGLDSPQAEIRNNLISENGAFSFWGGEREQGVGIIFGLFPHSHFNISNNWIVNNYKGICPWYGGLKPEEINKEALLGKDNEIHDNDDDLCSQDAPGYPWPPGFRK